MADLRCVICFGPLEDRPGRGRPPRYCSTNCRRDAETEKRKINERLIEIDCETRALRARLVDLIG